MGAVSRLTDFQHGRHSPLAATRVAGELYIKIGLVLLGAEVLFSRLLALGIPGVFVSWIVTPVVLISTYVFGQRVLKLESRTLNMVISADMSVCGVSAAIATAAACRAKNEELTLGDRAFTQLHRRDDGRDAASDSRRSVSIQ